MSDRTAKSHSNISHRASRPLDRKPVFKSVLSNPFAVQWPSVPIGLQGDILAGIVPLFNGVADFHGSREEAHRSKRKLAWVQDAEVRKKRRQSRPSSGDLMVLEATETSTTVEPSPLQTNQHGTPLTTPLSPPSILRYLTIGINQVTKRLESQAHRKTSGSNVHQSADEPQQLSHIRYVFVCLEDVNPPALIRHLPQLVAACNSVPPPSDHSETAYPYVKIVPLPRGAEATLATALGLRRVAVMAVDQELPCLSDMASLLDSVPVLRAPWMLPVSPMEPTHIKQLRTSAPKDMRDAKEQRAEGRAAAKLKKKQAQATATAAPAQVMGV